MNLARVEMWGSLIGAVSWDPERQLGFFEYDPEFQDSGIQLAPVAMPLSSSIHSFPALGRECFHGLPGLLADVLPDRFGNALIDAWLATQGRTPESFNPVERLCYTGRRGMGALEFAPTLGEHPEEGSQLDLAALVELASDVLNERSNFHTSLDSSGGSEQDSSMQARAMSMRDILQVGTSAGGARAKAVIAWNPDTGEVRSGQIESGSAFSHWILKFDGVSGNRDRELSDPQGFGLIEYAYHHMALAAGIRMNECQLLSENGRHHFVTRRFDRTESGAKLHMQSLSALAHLDFNLAGAHSYEQAMLLIRQLDLPMESLEEQFRRMAFNIVARNQDDHVKNIAFLMDKSGQWSLSPAYDLTYSYNPKGDWTRRHQMTLNGKRDDFTQADFQACANSVSMKRGRAAQIFEQVHSAVQRWPSFAEAAGISEERTSEIQNNLRLQKL